MHVGFFYLTNHGIGRAETRGMFAACERFFSIPQVRRDELYLVSSPNYRGYLPIGVLGQNTERHATCSNPSISEWSWPDDPTYETGKPLHGGNQWPAGLPGFRDAIIRYYSLMDGLMHRLLQGFAMSADFRATVFDHLFRNPLTQMRLLHYPRKAMPQGNMIERGHIVTSVSSRSCCDEVGGLEVSNQSGEWVVAPPMEGAFVSTSPRCSSWSTNGQFSSAFTVSSTVTAGSGIPSRFFANPATTPCLHRFRNSSITPIPHNSAATPWRAMLSFYRIFGLAPARALPDVNNPHRARRWILQRS